MKYNLNHCISCFGEGVPVTHSGKKGSTPFTSCRFFRGYIKCKKCGFTSPVKSNPKAMVSAWNSLATATQTKQDAP